MIGLRMQHKLDNIIYWTPSLDGHGPIPEKSKGSEKTLNTAQSG